jgi:hypothetical protein
VRASNGNNMNRSCAICAVAVAFLTFIASSRAIYIPPTHYEKPPQSKTKPNWPDALADVIADATYVDGYSYANPGYVVEMNDTFFYDGDTETLVKFIEKLRGVKNLDVKVTFSKAAGRSSEFTRAGIVFQGQVLGQDIEKLGGKPCSWLVTVTDKQWAEHSGKGSNTQAEVLIFLGSPRIDPERLRL